MMKKLFLTFTILLLAIGLNAQNRPVLNTATTTINGAVTDTIDLNIIPGLEYLSFQFVPALTGEGDSLDFSWTPQVSNLYSGDVWTNYLPADTVNATEGDTDAVYEFAPWQFIRARVLVTGISTDTVTVNLYSVYK